MTYQLTRAQFEVKRQILADNKITVAGDSGTISHDGVEVSFSYSEPTLTVDIIKKPFELTQHFVEGKINAWFGQVG